MSSGLLLEAVEPCDVAAGVDRALDRVELAEQRLAVVEALGGNGQVEVLQQLAAAAGIERGIGQAELAGMRAGCDAAALGAVLAIDFVAT